MRLKQMAIRVNETDEVKNPYGESKEAKAIWECLKRMYRKAQPSADIGEIVRTGEGKMPRFYMAYFLSENRIGKIIDEVCNEFKIKAFKKQGVKNSVWIGSSPNSCKETWIKEREDYDKRLKEFLKKHGKKNK